jgi:hypothetical protein
MLSPENLKSGAPVRLPNKRDILCCKLFKDVSTGNTINFSYKSLITLAVKSNFSCYSLYKCYAQGKKFHLTRNSRQVGKSKHCFIEI